MMVFRVLSTHHSNGSEWVSMHWTFELTEPNELGKCEPR